MKLTHIVVVLLAVAGPVGALAAEEAPVTAGPAPLPAAVAALLTKDVAAEVVDDIAAFVTGARKKN